MNNEPDGIIDGVVAGWPRNHPACVESWRIPKEALAFEVGIAARVITRLEVFENGGENQTVFRFGGVATSKNTLPKVLRDMARSLYEFAEKYEYEEAKKGG